MIFDKIFNKGKREKQLLEARQSILDNSIEKSNQIQASNNEVQKSVTEVQKSVMEIAWKNQQLNEDLTKLVANNERTRNILLERENKIQITLDDLEERKKEVRKEEIELIARKSETRKNEQLADEHQKKLDAESKRVAEREGEAEKAKSESESEKEKYQSLYDELEVDKGNIKTLEEEARRKNKDADEKTVAANAIFEKAKVIDDEIKAKEAKFEEHREAIEKSLKEKIEEYDRRLEDLNAIKGIVDDVKFDDSEDGKQAKIVVKEAIRQAKKALTDIKTKFDELDEKYASGTFKGFSTPLTEIDKYFEELKTQYTQVKEHFASEQNLPSSVSKWLSSIEDCINNADRSIKSWEFSEAYRNIVFGIATCKNYELLLIILNDFAGGGSEESTATEGEDFIDWYEILEVKPDATDKEIKKAFNKLMLKYHPDRAPEEKKEEYHEKAVLLNQANDVLRDPEKRKIFDEKRNNRKQKNSHE
jgi:hypothetical protein